MDELPVLIDDDEGDEVKVINATPNNAEGMIAPPPAFVKKPRKPRLAQKTKAIVAASSFDEDKTKSLKELQDIRSDKSRAGKVDKDIMGFVGAFRTSQYI